MTQARPRVRATLVQALATASILLPATAQDTVAVPQDDAPVSDEDEPETVVITPTLSEERPFDVPWATDVIDSEDLARRGYRTTPQALGDVPGVMVQETAHGHGSPYIRGFTSFRNLFLVDGIRLNNSVFRPGPNQYWNTVDPYSLDRFEVVKGPASVLYGSDAIGGTVHAVTRSPYAAPEDHAGELYYRAASAENSNVVRAEVAYGIDEDWGALLGVSWKDYGDVEGGSDVGVQENTGYDETDFDFKVEGAVSPNMRVVAAHQRVRQNDVPRTHRTVFAIDWEGLDVGSDLQRDFDQERDLTYVQLHTEGLDGFFDSSMTSVSWHAMDEERDRIRSNGDRELQGFDVGTLGVVQHFHSTTDIGELTYGLELYHDSVDSFTDRGGNQTAADEIQGPVADDATYDLFGVFVQDEIEVNERLTLTFGTRLNYAEADANEVRDPVTDAEISIEDDWSAVVGSARFVYALTPDRVNLFGGVSQGFRAPNLSDLTRFDSARTNEFEVPAPDLDPEHTTSFELGVKVEDDDLSTQVSAFYTDVRDQILRVPTGNTNAQGEFEVTKDNVGDGYLWGVEVGAAYRLDDDWTLFGNATYLEGKRDTFPTSAPVEEEEYFDRLMPLTAQIGVRWEPPASDLWGEVVGRWADDADKLSTRDEADTSRTPPGGTPSYEVLDLRGGWRVDDGVELTVGLENVTDEDYRIHGSGVNRPGRNLLVGLRVSF